MSKKWSEEDIIELEKMYENSIPREEIANMLHRSKNSINHRISILKLKEKYPESYKDNIIGKTYGRLTVIEDLGMIIKDDCKYKRHYFKCLCCCKDHNEVVVEKNKLITGHTKSCGCLQKEFASNLGKEFASKAIEASKKTNVYKFCDDYVIGYDYKGKEFYFDINDFEIVKNYCWSVSPIDDDVYTTVKGKNIYMHRLLMNVENKFVVDHINHIRYDNRKNNLRVCTQKENSRNNKIYSTNTSGYTGVYKDKINDKWIASICVNYKNINLGSYDDIEDAVKARKEAEEKYFGEYSYDNSMKIAKENSIIENKD